MRLDLMLQKILVAIGDLPDSEQIFTAGLKLAQKLDAEILILHVLDYQGNRG
jgi:nucleotide-binding universal stress UspA family protein